MSDAVVLEGPVFKLKERRPVWKAIHVVLLPGKQLVYYANAEDARAQRRALTRPKVVLSAVAMGTGTEFSRLADFGPEAAAAEAPVEQPHYFVVETTHARKLFCVPSASYRDKWVAALNVASSERRRGSAEKEGTRRGSSEKEPRVSQPLLDATLPRSDGPSSASESPRAGSPVHAADVKHTEGGFVDRMIERQLDKILARLGVAALEEVKDPYMPRWLRRNIDAAFREAWPVMQSDVRELVLDAIATGDKEMQLYRELRLKHWATGPPAFCRRPFSWCRAQILHTLLPADMSQWQVARDPNALCLLLLAVCPYFGISTWMFVLLFFLIDKRDEYQLCDYILKFKATQFLSSGIPAATLASAKLYMCAIKDYAGDCATGAPGTHSTFIYEIVVEPIRIVILWLAFALLACGYARGGREELFALEAVRIDAADGQLDGVRDLKLLRKLSLEEGRVSYTSWQMAALNARAAHGVQRRTGGVLPYFLLYDVLSVALSVALLGFAMWWNELTTDDWAFWTSLYFMKGAYAMLSAPFLLFFGPLSQFLTHARPTGYDKAGLLCPSLSARECRSKYQLDQSRKKKKEEERRRERAREMGPPSGGGTLRRVVRIGQARRASTDGPREASASVVTTRKTAAASAIQRSWLWRQQTMRLGLELDTPGALEVSILSGHELTAADPNGLSDPYVKVRVGHHRKQTRFLPCTLEPNWDETVALRGRLRDFVDQELLLKVRDHDVGAIRDDRLGEFRIMRLELDELRASARRPLEFHHAKLDGEGAGYGYISFELQWKPRDD